MYVKDDPIVDLGDASSVARYVGENPASALDLLKCSQWPFHH